MKINRADRVVHLHAVRDECIAYAIPMQRPVPVPVSGRSPALLSARADPSERASERASEQASEEEEAARRRGERGRKKNLEEEGGGGGGFFPPDLAKLLHFSRRFRDGVLATRTKPIVLRGEKSKYFRGRGEGEGERERERRRATPSSNRGRCTLTASNIRHELIQARGGQAMEMVIGNWSFDSFDSRKGLDEFLKRFSFFFLRMKGLLLGCSFEWSCWNW